MKKADIASLILEESEVRAPEAIKIDTQVRTGVIFPLPAWARPEPDGDDSSKS